MSYGGHRKVWKFYKLTRFFQGTDSLSRIIEKYWDLIVYATDSFQVL